MTSIKDRLAAAKLPERSIQVCLRGDLAAEFDELERKLREVREDAGPRRVATKSEAAEIAGKMRELQEQMRAEMVTLRVRALPRAEWQKIVRDNPPREDNAGDMAVGGNLTGIMEHAIPRCVVEPEMDAEDWEQFNNVISAGDYDQLMTVVFDVNRSGASVPKSRLASLVMSESDAASK